MKIEMGESLIYSWLRHIKKCQIVQLNWKVSNKWDSTITNELSNLMNDINKRFDSVFGKTDNLKLLLKQSEVDVIGFDFNSNTVYGVDVAFHTFGLRYKDNVKNVTKKIFRTLLTLDVYFDNSYNKEVIFTTPKINPNEYNKLIKRINEINQYLKDNNLDTVIYFISNEKFEDDILNPILSLSDDIADTSELFLRSYQLTKIFDKKKKKSIDTSNKEKSKHKESNDLPIGQLVKNSFQKLFKSKSLSENEVLNLMDNEYSKKTFDLNYPILKQFDDNNEVSPQRKINGYDRYYANLFDGKYLLCNDWYDRNRLLFLQWLNKVNCK